MQLQAPIKKSREYSRDKKKTFYLSLFEFNEVFFLNSESDNTIKDFDPGIVTIRNLEEFFEKFHFQCLEVRIISTASEVKSRGKKLFNKLWNMSELVLSYCKVSNSDEIIQGYEKLVLEYKKNSIIAYLSQNYPIGDIRKCKHLKVSSNLCIENLEIMKDFPLNSVLIYSKEDDQFEEAIFNILLEDKNMIYYGDIAIDKSKLGILKLSSSEMMSFLHKVEKGEEIACYFPKFSLVEGIRERMGVPSMHCIELRKSGFYTKCYGKNIYLGEINDSYENLILRLTNSSRFDRIRICKMVETIIYYVSRLSINKPYRISNVLFSWAKDTPLADYLWPILGIRTNDIIYIIDIEQRKIKKMISREFTLEELFCQGFGSRIQNKESFNALSQSLKGRWKL